MRGTCHVHSRELVSVAVNVCRYQSVCACVYVCAVCCFQKLQKATTAACLYLSSLNGLVQQSRLPQYLESRLREPGWPGFVGGSPYKRVEKGPL